MGLCPKSPVHFCVPKNELKRTPREIEVSFGNFNYGESILINK
jgi:hypothetical protein